MGWYQLCKILNSSPRNHSDWFYKVHFKLILLSFLFLRLYFLRQILVAPAFCDLIYFQSLRNGASINIYVLSKKIKTDMVNKSAFANRKLIVI